MNTPKIPNIRSAIAMVALIASSGAAHAYSSMLATPDLGGQSYNVTWTNLSSTNPTRAFNAGVSTGDGSLTVTGAFSATLGLYSFSGDYAFGVSAGTPFSARHVVLQYVGGANPAYDYLDFSGGPVLTYSLTDGSGQLAASASATLAGPVVYPDSPVGDVEFYSFAWEWDLTSVVGTITGISVHTPVPIHTSTTGIRIDIGDTFAGSAIAVPEPAAFAMFAGVGSLALAAVRRRSRQA